MIAWIIGTILLVGYVSIGMCNITKVSKAATAMFMGTVCWVLYVSYGTDFVGAQHAGQYQEFLSGSEPSSELVKEFISRNVFLKYMGRAAEISMFLLATMIIVRILDANGCLDFVNSLTRTRKSRKLLWIVTAFTFVLSANVDTLTTALIMLVFIHRILPARKQRIIFGASIVISANCGGALSVIGDPIGLMLWSGGHVTATAFASVMSIPCLLGWVIPTLWLGRQLPDRVDKEWTAMPYRGDDTRLNVWQRLLMFVVGIGGLWFIPTFHDITKLSPFLGAACVLTILWMVDEVINRSIMASDSMQTGRQPAAIKYDPLQQILFVTGMMLVSGVFYETGIAATVVSTASLYIDNVWVTGVIAGGLSTVLDSFASASSMTALMDAAHMTQNSVAWPAMAFSCAMGGNVLMLGSVSGIEIGRAHV